MTDREDPLKACPFCGAPADDDIDVFQVHGGYTTAIVSVGCCANITRQCTRVDQKEAIEMAATRAVNAWNNRSVN